MRIYSDDWNTKSRGFCGLVHFNMARTYTKRGRELGEVLRIYRDEALPLHIRLHDQRSVAKRKAQINNLLGAPCTSDWCAATGFHWPRVQAPIALVIAGPVCHSQSHFPNDEKYPSLRARGNILVPVKARSRHLAVALA
jgi:hypothetical protein